ncbi:MAG TPA: hypothetical protein VMH90_06805 [Thermoplasmata archaeon]|nr:hypothetical protein [Thermoplasmata archaeon]
MSAPAAAAPAPRPAKTAAPRPPPAAPAKKRGRIIWLLVFVVAAVIILAVIAATQLGASVNNVTVEPNGTTWVIPPDHFQDVSFTLSKPASVQASLVASNGVEVYALTPTAYSSFQSSGSTTTATWASGPISTGSFSVALGAGSWHLDFICPSSGVGTTVLFTSSLTATAT